MTVAMAFDYFASQKVDVAVIETGLGGRLDSTNIITPVLSIITNISLDHTEFLGQDLSSIAREKGGIIKPGVPVVLGRTEEAYEGILVEMARAKEAPLVKSQDLYTPSFYTQTPEGKMIFRLQNRASSELESYTCDLAGIYQQENLVTALCSIQELQKLGWELSPPSVKEGLASVTTRTGIMGRWQTVGFNPRSICDTAHNADGIQAVMEQIRQVPRKELHVVWGLVSDKDLNTILPLLPKEARYYFTQSSVPRSLDHLKLLNAASSYNLEGGGYPTVEEAYRAAQEAAGPHDLIFTGGSTFVVADLLTFTLTSGP
jgi:dihydrofolate synthase/folylpolyglutamate synthase